MDLACLHHGRMPSRDTPVQAPTAQVSMGHRWDEMLLSLAGLLPAGPASVLVDGGYQQPAVLATRLAATRAASGRACVRLTCTDGDTQPDGDVSGDTVRLA